jgi:hypothetical protein
VVVCQKEFSKSLDITGPQIMFDVEPDVYLYSLKIWYTIMNLATSDSGTLWLLVAEGLEVNIGFTARIAWELFTGCLEPIQVASP